MSFNPTIINKQARYNFELIQNYISGIMLIGTEVKSIRLGKVNIKDAYCSFKDNELFIHNMTIQPYEFGNIQNCDSNRIRKLLLNKRELLQLKSKVEEKGLTIIPIKLFFNDRNLIKLEISLARGKNLYDKRQSIKDRDIKRELNK